MSRPLLGLLVATVAFFALWMTMLKPHGSDTAGNGTPANPSLGQLNSAVAAAHRAVATSNAASVTHGGVVATSSATHTATAPHTTPAARATSAAHARTHARPRAAHHSAPVLTPAARLRLVAAALEQRKVLAMLFYNPSGADDRLVRGELAAVATHRGAVVKLAIPITELASYSIVTRQVPVTGSPTLVIVDRAHGATELVGFSDRFEIAQRIDGALTVHPLPGA